MKKLLFILLITAKSVIPFDYNHDIFILGTKEDQSFPLSKKTTDLAFNLNNYLNVSKFFDTRFIADPEAIQKELSKDPQHKEITLETEDKQKITCSFFDRKKNKIIIIGPGFTNNKEKMIPFVHMFNDYDILIMNFRGHGYRKDLCLSPLYHLTEVDSSIKLGTQEEKDVFAVIDHVRKLKKYETLTGLGICFGAFIFAKTQGIAEQKGITAFDKIILDGCWPSLREFIEKLKNDPYLIIDPQRGGISPEVKWILSGKTADFIINSVESFLGIDFNSLDIRDYLKEIKTTPVLFFYGKDDLTIDRKHFEDIFNGTSSPNKFAVITNNPHVHNHLKSKELYKLISDLFIETDIPNVVYLLKHPGLLQNKLISVFEKQLETSVLNYIKPTKLRSNKAFVSFVKSYKWPAIIFSSLLAGFKTGKINKKSLGKFAAVYLIYKFVQFGWRPIVKLIASL